MSMHPAYSVSFHYCGELAMAQLAGGPCVIGSSMNGSIAPHWENLDPFAISVSYITESQFVGIMQTRDAALLQEIGGGYRRIWKGRGLGMTNHPMTCVNWNDGKRFMEFLSEGQRTPLRYPTEIEAEYAIRGMPRNMREVAARENVKFRKPSGLLKFMKDRFENGVGKVEMGAKILTGQDAEEMFELFQKNELWAWQVYGTANGRLSEKQGGKMIQKNAHYGEYGEGKANLTREIDQEYLRNLMQSDWTNEIRAQREEMMIHSYGLVDGCGNVWGWCENNWIDSSSIKILRGGSWDCHQGFLHAAFRHFNNPGNRGNFIGFRSVVGAPGLIK